MLVVATLLFAGHYRLVCPRRTPGQFVLDGGLSPAKKNRGDRFVQFRQIAHALVLPLAVKGVESAVEAKEASEQRRIHEVHKRIEFVNAVFNRRAGQDKRIGRDESLQVPRRLRLPVLDTLGLVQDD